ncbi:hypothetical protein [Chryseobacterium sp. C3]|uniref:hypothetical protein n=1 Tax=Chryseobacterium sp. C3 TaxID=2761532 RepID=UPI0016244F05|nr:hypothetical protein [Chryseobacterium sp. C3]
MKKVIFGMFLLAGTTFGFANSTESINILDVKGKECKITSIKYSEDGQKCTVTASYNNGNGNYGTITVTASTCAKAAMIITTMLAQGE